MTNAKGPGCIASLAINIGVGVLYLIFWSVWPVATFVIGCLMLTTLVLFFWMKARKAA